MAVEAELMLGQDIKPASGIESWGDWPEDVRELLREWNKGRPEARLSFYRRGPFDCADCGSRYEPAQSGVACIKPAKEWLCDDCLVARARAMLPIRAAYGAHRRAGHIRRGCICPTPARKPDDSYDWKIDPTCAYHRLAAEFPDDHSIPWNCPTFWDGCNCTRPKRTRPVSPWRPVGDQER